ncbi:hypothetical protein VNO80_09793 [Phaseolus coccineus]|uniref:Uncharacterized protein n=1 Tax=Phaseolus coccineus TaxID=3886 RepID=A0AAN9R9W5_PHACN
MQYLLLTAKSRGGSSESFCGSRESAKGRRNALVEELVYPGLEDEEEAAADGGEIRRECVSGSVLRHTKSEKFRAHDCFAPQSH